MNIIPEALKISCKVPLKEVIDQAKLHDIVYHFVRRFHYHTIFQEMWEQIKFSLNDDQKRGMKMFFEKCLAELNNPS